MEESPSGLDPAGLAEAPELVCAVSQAMEGLAAQIQSRDGKWAWKAVGPQLELLRVYMLRIWFLSAAAEPQRAGDKALALQAREATYFIDDLQDLILRCCTLARRAKIFSLPALWFCWNRVLGLVAPKPPRRIRKDIKVVNTETRRIGNLLQKVADPSATSLTPPDSGRETTLQPKDLLAQLKLCRHGNLQNYNTHHFLIALQGIYELTVASKTKGLSLLTTTTERVYCPTNISV